MSFQIDSAVHGIRGTMDTVCAPMFLLSVDDDRCIRFVALNLAHEEKTGMLGDDLAGQTPHQALPKRLADTVLANYTECLRSAAPFTYEEVLDLPSGVLHWQTTLSPIFSEVAALPRKVVGIVGVACDITPHKHEIRRLLDGAAALRRQCEDVAINTTATVSRLRGPLALILSLVKTVEPDPTAAGSSAEHLPTASLQLLTDKAREAIAVIDTMEGDNVQIQRSTRHEEADFGHLVADQSALIDPEGHLALSYPKIRLRTDVHLLENILSRCFEIVAFDAASFARITVDPLALDMHHLMLRFTFDTDRHAPTCIDAQRHGAMKSLQDLVASQGGSLDITWDGDHHETTLEMSIPGRVEFRAIANLRPASPSSVPVLGHYARHSTRADVPGARVTGLQRLRTRIRAFG